MTAALDTSDDLQALLDAAVDAVILIDHRGLIQIANRSAERLFGYARDSLIGLNVSMLMPDADRRAHDGYIERYIRTGDARVIGRGRDVVAQRRDGTTFPAQLSVGVVQGADPPRFAGFVHDLTGQRALDAQMRLAQERLARVARYASMGEMAAGLSHELNQPLAAIATYAQACERLLANDEPPLESVTEALGQIASQALRAGEIIRRLRHLVTDRKTEHRRETLNDVVEEMAQLASHDLAALRTTLDFSLASDLPAVEIDRVQIQQVLLNLVRNAAEALSGQPVATRRVTLATRAASPGVEITVRDTGAGIDDEVATHMFEPFFTTKAEGTGLGLAISRTIARAHQGTLGYRRTSGGAEFYLRLPALEDR
ncbi:MAG: PAS domain S-box protein [Steroidobacteraceae bacterium]